MSKPVFMVTAEGCYVKIASKISSFWNTIEIFGYHDRN